jgi:hypothetical protein
LEGRKMGIAVVETESRPWDLVGDKSFSTPVPYWQWVLDGVGSRPIPDRVLGSGCQ